jgi:hypothetical protein
MARRSSDARRRQPDLLVRPPCGPAFVVGIDPVEQLKELVDLRERGLLSGDEFERQKARLLEA